MAPHQNTIAPHQAKFIDFMLDCEALLFGEFTLKSGRLAPYYINSGSFDTGSRIEQLGSYYAQHIVSLQLAKTDVVFGPAYKGIPLAVSTAEALACQHAFDVGYAFDRKEVKDHGDKGIFVGKALGPGDAVVIVEDVISAGTTFRHIVPLLREQAQVDITAIVIAVDRCERGVGKLSAVQELKDSLNVDIYPLVSIHQILAYLSQDRGDAFCLSASQQAAISAYLGEYGA